MFLRSMNIITRSFLFFFIIDIFFHPALWAKGTTVWRVYYNLYVINVINVKFEINERYKNIIGITKA